MRRALDADPIRSRRIRLRTPRAAARSRRCASCRRSGPTSRSSSSSGRIGEDRGIELMRAGAHDYVMKDQLGRLLPVVERELRETTSGVSAAASRTPCAERAAVPRALRERQRHGVHDRSRRTVHLDQPRLRGHHGLHARGGAHAADRPTWSRRRTLALIARASASLPPAVETGGASCSLTVIGKDGRRIATEVTWRPIVRDGRSSASRRSRATSPSGAASRSSSARRRRWRRSAGSPAASRTTSTTCSWRSPATASSCSSGSRTTTAPAQRRGDPERRRARAAALTRQLLTFSRKQVLRPAVIDLNDVVSDIESMLRRLIGEDVDVLDDAGAAARRRIKADRGQIEQVVMNLVVNARDAMPAGGELHVELTRRLDDRVAREPTGTRARSRRVHRARRPRHRHRHVDEAVLHTSSSRSSPRRRRARAPASASRPSTASSRRAAAGSSVQSAEGQGLDVPRGPARRRRRRGADAGSRRGFASLPRGTETVLLVEDEPAVRELIRDFLSRCGYTVARGQRGDRRRWRCSTPIRDHLHLLVTDVVMPRMNGRELAEQLVVATARPAGPLHVRVHRRQGARARRRQRRGVPAEAVHARRARPQGARGARRRAPGAPVRPRELPLRRACLPALPALALAAAFVPWPPGLVERVYATTVYPAVQPRLTCLTNLVPFACLDVLPGGHRGWLSSDASWRRGADGGVRRAGRSAGGARHECAAASVPRVPRGLGIQLPAHAGGRAILGRRGPPDDDPAARAGDGARWRR